MNTFSRELARHQASRSGDEGTYVANYTASAQYLLPREATRVGFVVRYQTRSSPPVQHYERSDLTVTVCYDGEREVLGVRVEPATASYPPTYAGAMAALQAPAGPPRANAPTGPPWPTWTPRPGPPS